MSSETPNGTVTAELTPAPGGTFTVTKLTLVATDGQALSSADQYAISIPQLIAEAELAEQEFQSERASNAYAGEWDQGLEGLRLPGRPDGSNGWYLVFASVFRKARVQSKSPAAAIAEENDVLVTAVHRWTRECRRRGFLPPDIRTPERKI